MEVLVRDDIGDYAMLRAGYRNDNVTSGMTRAYWFPDQEVASGDLVMLHSKDGVNNSRRNSSGNMSHHFYWRSSSPLWGKENHAPVLLHVDSWNSSSPPFSSLSGAAEAG